MARREYQGGAVVTTLTGGITSGAASLVLTTATGWPTGSFSAVIDKGLSGEEKILCTSRSGTTVTITTRGYDGTTASSHLAGASIAPCLTAIDLDEANAHVVGTLAQHAATTSAQLASIISDETGSGALVFGTSPTIGTPTITSPTITGAVFNDGSVVFEGTTADAFETTLAVTDPTADRTITFPDASGTVALTDSYTSTATAAGTTTLTVASTKLQVFTGTTTQTVVLPVVTTLPELGYAYKIINDSTGIVTVQSSGGNTVYAIPAGVTVDFICILLTGTTAASWLADYPATSSGALTKITSATFSAVANTGTTFDGVFTSAYKNYLVEITDFFHSVGNVEALMVFRYGGVSKTTGYYGSRAGSNTAGTYTALGTANLASMQITLLDAGTNKSALTLHFSKVGNTSENALFHGTGLGGFGVLTNTIACVVADSQIYDGFQLSAASGTITGRVAIYGLAN